MPYITPSDRAALTIRLCSTAGELNYEIHNLIFSYLTAKGLSYQTINDVMGVMTGVQAEFYRRIAAPYEEKKLRENGDIDLYKIFAGDKTS
jgi:hypothetical protein